MSKNLLQKDVKTLEAIRQFIASNLDKELLAKNLAKQFLISTPTLRRQFAKHYRKSLYAFILQCRMRKAMELLNTGSLSIKEISLIVGYQNTSGFSHAFSKHFGTNPQKFQAENPTPKNDHFEQHNGQFEQQLKSSYR